MTALSRALAILSGCAAGDALLSMPHYHAPFVFLSISFAALSVASWSWTCS